MVVIMSVARRASAPSISVTSGHRVRSTGSPTRRISWGAMAGQAIGVPQGHYFDEEPGVASARRTVPLVLPDLSVTLTTDRGVFARDAVDPGTKLLLLDGPRPPAAGDLLDLGCGYGPLSVALARRAPGAQVWAVDVNRRALALCAENAAAAGVEVRTATPDEVPDEVRFSGIWSN